MSGELFFFSKVRVQVTPLSCYLDGVGNLMHQHIEIFRKLVVLAVDLNIAFLKELIVFVEERSEENDNRRFIFAYLFKEFI